MIRVARNGLSGSVIPSSHFMVIGGVLHQAFQPTWRSVDVWLPVPVYVGPIQEVDYRARDTPAAPETDKTEGMS